jgi:hypothetical protein
MNQDEKYGNVFFFERICPQKYWQLKKGLCVICKHAMQIKRRQERGVQVWR